MDRWQSCSTSQPNAGNKKRDQSSACSIHPIIWKKMLRYTDVGDVLGIGSRLSARLTACNITTAWDLACADPLQISRDFSIVVERTVRELQGEY